MVFFPTFHFYIKNHGNNLRHDLSLESAHVLPEDRIGMRPPTANQIDLTQSKLFLSSVQNQSRLVQAVREHHPKMVLYKGTMVSFQVPLHVVLTNLRQCFLVWHRYVANPSDFIMYPTWTKEFGEAWEALLWKSTPWVHWLVVHSAHLLMEHRSIRMFSSIPTEYRHRAFKLDIQHSYLGNKEGLFISDTLLVSSYRHCCV